MYMAEPGLVDKIGSFGIEKRLRTGEFHRDIRFSWIGQVCCIRVPC
jgi:hypothetical protein